MHADDGALWRRARDGDGDAFGLLFERYAPRLHGYCFRRTGDWTLAEDLVSVTFLEAWRSRSRATLAGPDVLPWLYGVATNVVRNAARGRRRYAAALSRLPRPADEPDHAADAAERLAGEQRVRALLASLRDLPRRELDAVALVCWQGLTHAEAAAALGVPEGTVRTRLFRARARLARTVPAPGPTTLLNGEGET